MKGNQLRFKKLSNVLLLIILASPVLLIPQLVLGQQTEQIDSKDSKDQTEQKVAQFVISVEALFGRIPDFLDVRDFQKDTSRIKSLLKIPQEVKLSSENCALEPYNFGVLLSTPQYTFYRSAAIGGSGLEAILTHLKKNNLPAPKSIIYMNKSGYMPDGAIKSTLMDIFKKGSFTHKEFALEEDQALGDGGAFAKNNVTFFHPLASDEGSANTYLDGKNPFGEETEVIKVDEILSLKSKEYYDKKGIKYQDRVLKGDKESFYNILDILLTKSGGCGLFHCKGGLHRTGMIALALRNLEGGIWTQKFIIPIKIKGYYNGIISSDYVLENLAEYEYLTHNEKNFRIQNILAMREISKDPRFLELKKQFGKMLTK
jgi:hypothetical protein